MAERLTAPERQLVEKAQAQAADFVSELEKVVLMSSPTENLPGVRATGDYFGQQLAGVGFQTRWITLPPELRRAGHLFAERKGTQGRRLLLIGHLDTVLPASGFRREGKRAFGSGVNDMKGGNLILLAALRALHRVGALANTQLIVCLTGDEEAPAEDLNATRRDLIETAKRSDYALVFEGAYKNTVTIARRGITFWMLEVQGATGHSAGIFSAASGSGAVFEAARILNEFHEELRREDGLTINPAVIVGGSEAELVDARGSASGKPNVIARHVLIRGDLRFLNPAQLARAKETMLVIAARNRPRASAQLHFEDRYPAMAPTPESAALLAQLDRVSQDLGYEAITACDPKIRGAGDVSFVAPFVPGIDGLGPRGIVPNFVGSRATLLSANNTSLGVTGAAIATFASVPSGANGTGLRPDDFAATAGQAIVSEQRQKRGILLPGSNTYSGFMMLERSLNTNGFEGYAEFGFRYSDYGASYPGFVPTITLAATKALNPFRTGVTPGFTGRAVRVFLDPIDLPDARTDSVQRAFRAVAGLKGKLLDDIWRWSADLSWDRTESRATTIDYLRFLATAVNAGIYNPLRDLTSVGLMPESERAKFVSYRFATGSPEITAVNVRANGDLLHLPGGPLAASFGTEARFETDRSANIFTYGAHSTLPGATLTPSSTTDTYRRILAGFTEITLPVVGAPNARLALQKLELAAALRYEAFDDFGTTLSPMVGVKIEPVKGIIARGSFGKGFLPPPQSSLFAPVVTGPAAVATFVDPRRPGQPAQSGCASSASWLPRLSIRAAQGNPLAPSPRQAAATPVLNRKARKRSMPVL